MTADDPSLGEIYRLVVNIDRAINGNGQPGLKSDLITLKARFNDHERAHSLGGFTRKQLVMYGGLALTAITTLSAMVSALVRHA